MDPATGVALASLIYGAGKDIIGGTGDTHGQRSKLNPRQQKQLKQLQDAIEKKGAGGAFGESADYYRDLLSPDSQTANEMFKPEQRRFNEEIIPGLSEQFAGMGAGGLSSSGFRNAAVGAGTDLSERLGAIRAKLKAEGAAGLSNLGQLGLKDYTNNTYTPGTGGGAEAFAKGGGQLINQYLNQPAKTNPDTSVTSSPLPGNPADFNPNTGTYNSKTAGINTSAKGKSSPYGLPGRPGAGALQFPNRGGF
jgi:hypothetical protein